MTHIVRKNFRRYTLISLEKNTLIGAQLRLYLTIWHIGRQKRAHRLLKKGRKPGVLLKVIISLVITATGFILGMALAGVSFSAAGTIFKAKTESTKQLEKYWGETGLGPAEVTSLISNEKCASSEKYRNACLNAVIQNGSLGQSQPDLSEKELLAQALAGPVSMNFEKEILQLFAKEKYRKRPVLAAAIINAFLSVYYDPHTYIMPTGFFREVSSKIDRSKFFVGISYERKGSEFYIRKVSKNSDAEIAGLKVDDRIVSINNTLLRGLNYEDVSRMLKDEEASTLNFKLLRKNQVVDTEVTRSFRQLSHVQYNLIKGQRNFALITLSKFSKGTCTEMADSLKLAQKEKVSGVVVDLRDNPGGFLDEAACMAGLFLGRNKKAYYVEFADPDKSNEVMLTSEEQIFSGPLAVIVNASSASAAESFAGVIQDYKRGVIVGQRTFGKGTFQEPEEWPQNKKISLFKTQGFYMLPTRNSTQLAGVTPDLQVDQANARKREKDLFFNPLHAPAKKYQRFAKKELVKNFEYGKCQASKNLMIDQDIFLQKSLQALECAHEIQPALAQSSNSLLN